MEQQLTVELGSIELAGSGAYQLDIGEISVERNGGVRISAGDDGSRVQLLVGRASIRTSGGQVQALQEGAALELSDLQIRGLGVDAGRPPDRPGPDAAVPDAGGAGGAGADALVATVAVAVTGKGAEVRPTAAADGKEDSARWRALGAGTTALEPGSTVRVRSGGALTLDNGKITLEVASGGVVAIGPDRSLSLSAGAGAARSAPGATGDVGLPGGKVTLSPHRSGSRTELTVGRRDTRVRATGGALALTGRDATLPLRRGESASLTSGGALRTLVAVPQRHELGVTAGDSATVHDVRGAAAIQFRFGERCPGDGVIELDASASFRAPQVSAGEGAANLMVTAGAYHYRLRCESEAGDGKAVASGRIAVVRDSGRRPLAAAPPPFQLAVDGRTYRVGYQGAIPAMSVQWKGATGGGQVLHLAQGGKDQTFPASGASATIPGARLREGTYTLWFEKDGQRSKVSTLIIDFDNTAPAVYIDEPDDGEAWAGATVAVKGAVLPEWTVSVDGVTLPLDRQRRFSASVPVPASGALAITLRHPQRGTHYYLRRRR